MLLKKLIIYLLVSALSLPLGLGLSFGIDLAAILGESHAHDMGLTNLFMMVPLVFVIGQLICIYYFRATKPILIMAIVMALLGIGFFIYMN